MKRPIIGISSGLEPDSELNNYYRTTVSIDYTKSIIKNGGIPLILPITDDEEIIKSYVECIDGLILSGGRDINPYLYGENFNQGIGVISPERDDFEFKLLDYFYSTQKPILGICRGLQLINVYFKGSLYQDIKYMGSSLNHSQDFYPDLTVHKVKFIDKDNFLYKLYGEKISTNSFHHQMIKKLGDNLTVIGCADDGVIEAIQNKNHKFLYGVQWHPEMMAARKNEDMNKIFLEFVNACNRYKK